MKISHKGPGEETDSSEEQTKSDKEEPEAQAKLNETQKAANKTEPDAKKVNGTAKEVDRKPKIVLLKETIDSEVDDLSVPSLSGDHLQKSIKKYVDCCCKLCCRYRVSFLDTVLPADCYQWLYEMFCNMLRSL